MSDLLNQASLVMVPSGYKEDTVYSVVPSDGSGDLAFTRASNGTRVNSAGLVEVCPWNLLFDTNTFSSWNLEGGTLTSGFTAPDGSSTAYKYVQTTGGSLYSGSGGVTADVKCAQVWIKSVSGGSITVDVSDGAAYFGTFNVTGEWQLFTAPYTANSRIGLYLYGISNASGIYVWHPQVNIGSTAKPYFPTTDRLNVPRLTYQNGGGGCPSLLLEKQSTNIVTYSEEFDNAAWGKYQCSISANQTTSPDGTQNADKLTLAVGSGTYTGLVYRLTTPGANSIFMKNDSIGNGKFYIQVDGIGNARWNSDGTLASVSGGTATNGENMGNGWFRFTYVCSGGAYINYGIENGTTGDSIFIWGAQVEASSYPTSYIPTTTSSATRVADACLKTGISSLVSASEYTLFWQGSHIATGQYNSFMTVWQTSNENNSARFYRNNSNNEIRAAIFNASNGLTLDLGSSVTTTRAKCALRVKNGDFALFVNGAKVNSNTTALAPSSVLDSINLQYFNNTQAFEQNCEMACFFKTALSDTDAIALTTI